MNEIDHVHEAFRSLAVQNAGRKHRENHYTTVICCTLWPVLGSRILTWTGLGVNQLRAGLGAETDKLRNQYVRDTKDFYADLLLTDNSYQSVRDKDFCSLERFVSTNSITHIFEFKFLNAFTNMSRGHARKDTAKLFVLGEYLKNKNASGKMPYMEQVIFNFPASGRRPKSIERLRSWFTTGGFRERFKEVNITIVGADGSMEAV